MTNNKNKKISGFSKLDKKEKIDWVIRNYFDHTKDSLATLKKYWNNDDKLQNIHDEFIENAISNFYFCTMVKQSHDWRRERLSLFLCVSQDT